MYHAHVKVEYQPFNLPNSQLTYFFYLVLRSIFFITYCIKIEKRQYDRLND